MKKTVLAFFVFGGAVVYWNIARPQADSSGRVAAALRDLGVDLLCLAEVNPLRKRREAPFVETVEPQLPGYRRLASTAHIGLWVGARIGSQLEIVSSRREYLKVAWGFDLDLRWRGRPLRVLVVDFDSAPSTTRTRAMGPLREWVERQTAPWLVIGDFNMPSNSRALASLFPGHHPSWPRTGQGWGPTFPREWPLARIDHVLEGPGVEVTMLRTVDPGLSRHSLQTMTVVPRNGDSPIR